MYKTPRIDGDGDGLISEGELQHWIGWVQEREVREDTEQQWAERTAPGTEHITWEEYKKDVFGLAGEAEQECS